MAVVCTAATYRSRLDTRMSSRVFKGRGDVLSSSSKLCERYTQSASWSSSLLLRALSRRSTGNVSIQLAISQLTVDLFILRWWSRKCGLIIQ